jgi:hypothetical protein
MLTSHGAWPKCTACARRGGGVLDPLRYNPLINIYRRMATAVRTADEHPLGMDDLRQLKRTFRRVEARFFWLASARRLRVVLPRASHPSER